MAEQVILNLPDRLAKQVRAVADSTQRGFEEVLLEWFDRGRTKEATTENSEAELLKRINLGFSTDWWERYRGLIAERQAETISDADLAHLIEMSESIELANVGRIEALGELAMLRGCAIETVMADLGIGAGTNGDRTDDG
ncbi:MAG: hypothetical protein RLZZ511_1014 [Cyanobacteriota bacterium]|jgi:hypothetical protein